MEWKTPPPPPSAYRVKIPDRVMRLLEREIHNSDNILYCYSQVDSLTIPIPEQLLKEKILLRYKYDIYNLCFALTRKTHSRLSIRECQKAEMYLTLNRLGGGGGIHPQAGSSLCCAETLSSRKLKLSDVYYILIGFHLEYKPVPWDIHCCHGNAIFEECLL